MPKRPFPIRGPRTQKAHVAAVATGPLTTNILELRDLLQAAGEGEVLLERPRFRRRRLAIWPRGICRFWSRWTAASTSPAVMPRGFFCFFFFRDSCSGSSHSRIE